MLKNAQILSLRIFSNSRAVRGYFYSCYDTKKADTIKKVNVAERVR